MNKNKIKFSKKVISKITSVKLKNKKVLKKTKRPTLVINSKEIEPIKAMYFNK